jgi:hypothetical protein
MKREHRGWLDASGQGLVEFSLIIIALVILGLAIAGGVTAAASSPAAEKVRNDAANALKVVGADGVEQNTHPIERHGLETYEEITACIDGGGTITELVDPATQRKAKVCFLESCKKFGVKIEECNGDLVTTFKKDKMSFIDQILRYLANRGYEELSK